MNNDLISREVLLDAMCKTCTMQEVCEKSYNETRDFIQAIPAVDAVEVVRCKDCIYKAIPSCCPGQITGFRITDDWYCPMGVKEGD